MQSSKGEEVISSSNKASSQIDFVHRCGQLRCGVIIYTVSQRNRWRLWKNLFGLTHLLFSGHFHTRAFDMDFSLLFITDWRIWLVWKHFLNLTKFKRSFGAKRFAPSVKGDIRCPFSTSWYESLGSSWKVYNILWLKLGSVNNTLFTWSKNWPVSGCVPLNANELCSPGQAVLWDCKL